MCELSSYTKRRMSLFEENVTNHASISKCDTAGLQHCDDDVHGMSIVGSSTSNFDEASRSDNSDSTFYPVHADNDEHDGTYRLYNVEPSQNVQLKYNMHPLQNSSDNDDMSNVDDACSTEENNNDISDL